MCERIIQLETRSMRNNLIFSGLHEAKNEKEEDIRKLLKEVFDVMKLDPGNINVIRCHRLGRVSDNQDRPRDVVAVFDWNDKYTILNHAKNLRGLEQPVYVNGQYPAEVNKRRNILRPILKLAKSLKMNASMSGDRIMINGIWYTCDNINNIPISHSDLKRISTTTTEDHVFFHGRMSSLSNFKTCNVDIDGVKYCNIEQYFQRSKALYAKDHISASEIMLSTDPGKAKAIGDRVKSSIGWDKEQLRCMEKGLVAKFQQNPSMLQSLMGTGTKHIAEASVRDTFWGIGRGMRFANLDDTSTWTGNNELGKLLEKIRTRLAVTDRT